MWQTLVLIAWGARSNPLNQAFTILFGLILITQVVRYWWFAQKINKWERAFTSAKINFERAGVVDIKSQMGELQPPHGATSQLWSAMPPLLIMLGLLGTFIGLTLALAVIPFGGSPAAIQEGVKQALPSMGSAFWTSLSALGCSLLIRIATMLMESSFKRNVLKLIADTEPELIQYVEREAFRMNKPGAFLRPHSLREVLWQQNLEFNKHLTRLGSEISSAIRELPHSLSGGAMIEVVDDFEDAIDKIEVSVTPPPSDPSLFGALDTVAAQAVDPSLDSPSPIDGADPQEEGPIKKSTIGYEFRHTQSMPTMSHRQLVLHEVSAQGELLEELIALQRQQLEVLKVIKKNTRPTSTASADDSLFFDD